MKTSEACSVSIDFFLFVEDPLTSLLELDVAMPKIIFMFMAYEGTLTVVLVYRIFCIGPVEYIGVQTLKYV